MRRDARTRKDDTVFRNLMFWSGAVLLIAVITFGVTYAIYSSKVKSEARVSQLISRDIGELVPSLQTEEEIKSASSQIGKTVNEAQNDIKINTIVESQATNDIIKDENTVGEAQAEQSYAEEVTADDDVDEEADGTEKELSFSMPVEGDVVKEFAKGNLAYSETLKEWTTHVGIDIKADKTSVVKAAEAGIVKTIKNDPRYGITVTVEHKDGFKTVYANLLTAEFVSEGENIVQGQTVGTVGTSANFEVAEEPHLHFEIWKDGEVVDPKIYLK